MPSQGRADRARRDLAAPRLAYVLKAYPRSSEPFILSEIHRLETLGLAIRLFATREAEAGDRVPRHPVVDRIRARPEYLTPASSASAVAIATWWRAHWPRFAPAWKRVARRHPAGLVRGMGLLGRELACSRRSPRHRVKWSYLREFLHGADLADRLTATPTVRHLHAHFAHGATTVAWFASAISGLTFSFTGHAKDLYAESSNPGGALARKVDAAAFVVTCTEANRQMLDGLGTRTPVRCVYHGLNADFTQLLRSAAGHAARPTGRFRVLAVGRLVRKKGFDVLIDAAERLCRAGVPLDVRIVGSDGDHADQLRRMARDRRLEGVVHFFGPQDQRTLRDWYREADVFCLPCRVLEDGDRDGIPNVIMEAMACGTPVVTTSVSGIPEMVRDRVNGLLVPPDDPGTLADALTEAVTDRGLRAAMSDAARATAERLFDGDRLAGELAAIFREAVA